MVVCTRCSHHAQEGMVEAPRWLFPFTHGVDMRAIDYVVSLAKSTGSTLVAVSLISVPSKAKPGGARLEHIQQSKDFLEAVKWKAARYEVPVERHEVFTPDIMRSIATLTREMRCAGIILVTSSEREALLQAHEVKRLLINPPASLLIIRLSRSPAQVQRPHLGIRFLSWLRRLWGPNTQVVEEPLLINTEEHRAR
jgi:hypothetical protein